MRFLKRQYLAKPREWHLAMQKYRAHYSQIQAQLPFSVCQFLDLGLHDSRLLSINCPEQDQLQLELDAWTVLFMRVHKTDFPSTADRETWLYEEVYLIGSRAFELLVLFEAMECSIIAEDVRCFDKFRKRWIIGTGSDEDRGKNGQKKSRR